MESLTSQIIIAFIFGVIFIIAMLALALKFPKPTSFQYSVFRTTFSLAAAGVAAMIPGFINLEVNPSLGLLIRAGGALAVFVIVFFFNPAQLKKDDSEDSQTLEQVAAICYRLVSNSIEFLLVRTTGGRWTFPKGNIEPDEERWFAAEKEAFEEAGATGDIEHESLTKYLHEKKEWKRKGIEIKIHAFLLEVKKTQNPQEKNRNPTWFSPSSAEDALVEGRQFKYAEEFRRVLRETINRISSSQNLESMA